MVKNSKHSKESKQKLSLSHTGKSSPAKGHRHSEESKTRMRIAKIERCQRLGIGMNEDTGAKDFFKILNQQGFNLESRYFSSLGYYADGYDGKLKIWWEYDTYYHTGTKQKLKDSIRQNRIVEHFKSIGQPLRYFVRTQVDKFGKIQKRVVFNLKSMTAKEIAQILLSRQNASYSFVLDGATRTKLTHEGFQYAMQKGWIELDEVTSCMRLSMRAAKLEEIKIAAAAEIGDSLTTPPPSLASVGRDLAFNHATEIEKSTSSEVVSENAKPAAPVIIAPGNESWREFVPFNNSVTACRDLLTEYGPPTAQPVQPTQPATPGAEADYEVGEQVIMAEDGKTYQATVQAKQADGSLVLSFGTDKPSKIKPSYARNELQRAPTAAGTATPKPSQATPTASKPATPTPALPSGPAAPGIGRR